MFGHVFFYCLITPTYIAIDGHGYLMEQHYETQTHPTTTLNESSGGEMDSSLVRVLFSIHALLGRDKAIFD